MKRAAPEATLHRAVAAYLAVALPDDCWWSTFPAGGGGKVRGAQLKAMGLRAGVPDILILKRVTWMSSTAFWIELKAAKGRLSVEQKLCHLALERAASFVAVCRSIEDVQETLIGWGFQVKANVGRKGK